MKRQIFEKWIHLDDYKWLTYLPWSDFDVKVVTFVRDFQYLWPSKAIDTQPVAIHKQSGGTHTQHDLYAFGVLRLMQVHTVHGQFLCIFQVMKLCFGWCLTSAMNISLSKTLNQLLIILITIMLQICKSVYFK